MRISDWSSDVCSSDLRTADLRLCRHPPPGRGLAELRAALHRPQRFARPPWVRGDAGHPATRGPGVLADRRVARRSPPGDPVSRPSEDNRTNAALIVLFYHRL